MDLQHVLFSPEGRIGRQDFWIGWLILFAAGWMLHFVPLLGTVLWLISVYCWIVLYAKRLHDFGRSGWWAIVPILANFIGLGLLLGAIAAAVVGIAAGAAYADGHDAAWWAIGPVIGGALGAVWIAAFLGLVHLAFLLWVGLTPSDARPNRYGPPPSSCAPAPSPPRANPTPPPGVVP
jgi:uncharacterized membrane protein YhaH (DUF805 family)